MSPLSLGGMQCIQIQPHNNIAMKKISRHSKETLTAGQFLMIQLVMMGNNDATGQMNFYCMIQLQSYSVLVLPLYSQSPSFLVPQEVQSNSISREQIRSMEITNDSIFCLQHMCHEKSNGTFDMHKSGSYQHSQIHHRPLNFCNEDTVLSYDGSKPRTDG